MSTQKKGSRVLRHRNFNNSRQVVSRSFGGRPPLTFLKLRNLNPLLSPFIKGGMRGIILAARNCNLIAGGIFLFFFFIGGSGPLYAQPTTIIQIEVEGNAEVESGAIFKMFKVKKGEDFSSSLLAEDLRSIYEMGYFQDISIDAERTEKGVKLIFKIKEKENIEEIKFSGNKHVSRKKLEELIDFAQGDTCAFDQYRLHKNTDNIIRHYQKEGYYLVQVQPEVDIKEKGAAITFSIEEGERFKIRKVHIIGNENISDGRIVRLMEMKEGRYLEEKKLDEDLEKIRNFYHNEGYLLVQISEAKISLDEEKKAIFLEFEINEGPCFYVKEINLMGNTIFSDEEIYKGMLIKKGGIFNQGKFVEDLRILQARYAERGYILSRVIPFTEIDEDSAVISVTIEMNEEEKVYIEAIRITGNNITRDKVIRRELTVRPGEIFDTKKIIRSQQKIYNLGFFEKVDIATEVGSEKEKMVLVVKIEEKRTGIASFGAGYNSVDGLLGYLEWRQSNLFGTGRTLNLKYEFGAKKQNYELGYVEPWFLDTPTSLGLNIYSTTRDISDYYYKEQRNGASLSVGRPITDYNKIYLKYKYESVRIFDVWEQASDLVKKQEGLNLISSMSLSLVRDTRDNIFDATSGIYAQISMESAGGFLGGDNHFYKPTFDFRTYSKLFWDFVLALRLTAGMVDYYAPSTEVPVYEKFYAGGADSIRGYPDRVFPWGVSGGKTTLIGNAEIRFPIPYTEGFLKGIIFFDIGNAYENLGVNLNDLKKGVGFGMRINTPVGPIRFDYGYAINWGTWYPHFSIGQMF